jgi:hypothetical protein
VVLPRPEYGYEVEIHFPISQVKAADGTRSFYCNAPPYRILLASSFIMNPQDKRQLDDFLRITVRGAGIVLDLGTDPTGFYPFGPDFGDYGQFPCCLTGQTPTGQLFAPFGWFGDDYHLVMTAQPIQTPAYAFGSRRRQGDFSITVGSVLLNDLPYPENGFTVKNSYSYTTSLSKTGVPSTIDGRNSADNYVSEFELSLYRENAAAMVNAIADTFNNGVSLCTITDCGFYVFGINNGKKGIYDSCRFLGSSDDGAGNEIVVKVTHSTFDCFKIPLAFALSTTDLRYEYEWPVCVAGCTTNILEVPLGHTDGPGRLAVEWPVQEC